MTPHSSGSFPTKSRNPGPPSTSTDRQIPSSTTELSSSSPITESPSSPVVPPPSSMTASAASPTGDQSQPTSLTPGISITSATHTGTVAFDQPSQSANLGGTSTGSHLNFVPSADTVQSTSSSPFAVATTASSSHAALQGHSHVKAIAAGTVGGIAFLLVALIALIYYRRRRRRKHTPPSAEFREYVAQNEHLFTVAPRITDSDDGEHEPLPPFSHGDFSDPVYEKLNESRDANIAYGMAV